MLRRLGFRVSPPFLMDIFFGLGFRVWLDTLNNCAFDLERRTQHGSLQVRFIYIEKLSFFSTATLA